VNPYDPDKFQVYGINKGGTPAEICEGHCSIYPRNPAGFTPPDDIRDPFLSPRQALTVSGERFPIRTISAKRMEATLRDSPYSVIFVWGKIAYWDTFTDRAQPGVEPHLTQWCFAYGATQREFMPHATDYAENT
jgi:hypothetical protein